LVDTSSKLKVWPWIVLALTPLFFSTNLIFGKGVVTEVAPFTLAFLRWSGCTLILLPFVWKERNSTLTFIKDHTKLWFLLGFLGMWVCGAVVYVALQHTTAINSALIYTTSPIFIIIIQFIWLGRSIKLREILGIIAATLGVAYIVLKGELDRLIRLDLNIGDLLILGCAISWAIYSVLQKKAVCRSVPMIAMLGLATLSGAIFLAPFALYEFASSQPMPHTSHAWLSISGLVFFASLLAFGGTQHGIRHLGPEFTGMSLYLLPVYGTILAVTFLGEVFQQHHLIGIILVLGGVILASAPFGALKALFASKP
jgi:drug/metabolite transporter (DMT)-like permease